MVNLRWEITPAALSPFSSVLLSMHQFDALFDCLGLSVLSAWIAWIHGHDIAIWAHLGVSFYKPRSHEARESISPAMWESSLFSSVSHMRRHAVAREADPGLGWTCVCGCTRWSFRNASCSRANLSRWIDQQINMLCLIIWFMFPVHIAWLHRLGLPESFLASKFNKFE